MDKWRLMVQEDKWWKLRLEGDKLGDMVVHRTFEEVRRKCMVDTLECRKWREDNSRCKGPMLRDKIEDSTRMEVEECRLWWNRTLLDMSSLEMRRMMSRKTKKCLATGKGWSR
jgi:uncharacterized protein (DUF2461 family)